MAETTNKIREMLLALVDEERDKQVEKWGSDFKGRSFNYWLGILMEEVGEVAEAGSGYMTSTGDGTIDKPIGLGFTYDYDYIQEELIQVAAVALAWAEELGAMGTAHDTDFRPLDTTSHAGPDLEQLQLDVRKLGVFAKFSIEKGEGLPS